MVTPANHRMDRGCRTAPVAPDAPTQAPGVLLELCRLGTTVEPERRGAMRAHLGLLPGNPPRHAGDLLGWLVPGGVLAQPTGQVLDGA